MEDLEEEQVYKLFGFEIRRPKPKKSDEKSPSVVPPTDDDGAGYVTQTGAGYVGQYVDIDGDKAKDLAQLVMKYRGVAMHPDVDMALEEIVNESIVMGEDESPVNLVLDKIEDNEMPEKIKNSLQEEFKHILSLLNFTDNGQDMFKRWYVDGRLFHHIIIDKDKPKLGITEVRFMDASKVRKVREVKYEKDPETGVKVVKETHEYFIFQEKPGSQTQGVKLTKDSVSYVTSGLLDESRSRVISNLHKALKPTNQLRMMEDSLVIYRLARAPERRIFYIDIGNMQKGKAEEYMKSIRANYRNKLVYNSETGEMRDDRKHMTMLEDFWLPRREGGRGTEISNLPGGDNLGQIEDIIYFQKRLYRSLNVPLSRLEQETTFNLGRSNEVSREEIKFQKFIDKVRRKFSKLFLNLLKTHCVMKGILTEDDWEKWKGEIIVNYVRDVHWAELKDGEILRERLQTLDMATPYIPDYISKDFAYRKILRYSEDEIKELEKEKGAHEQEMGDQGFEKAPPPGHMLPDAPEPPPPPTPPPAKKSSKK